MIRASLNYVTWKDRKEVVNDLKPIYKAATDDEPSMRLVGLPTRMEHFPASPLASAA